jgi:hypothetical protein
MAEIPTLPSSKAPNNVSQQIARRAYELYESRGRKDGHDLEDWLRAETEIAGLAAKAAKA